MTTYAPPPDPSALSPPSAAPLWPEVRVVFHFPCPAGGDGAPAGEGWHQQQLALRVWGKCGAAAASVHLWPHVTEADQTETQP